MSNNLKDVIRKITEIDRDKIIRPEYGKTSLKEWESSFNKLFDKIEFISHYLDEVSSTTNQNMLNILININETLFQIINYNESEYVANKSNQIKVIEDLYNKLLTYYPFYAIAALDSKGLLGGIDFKKEWRNFSGSIKNASDNELKRIKSEADLIIDKANKIAFQIENKARETAIKISVKEAQEQFVDAVRNDKTNILIWSAISIFSIFAFTVLIILLFNVKIPEDWNMDVAYKSVLRIASLGFGFVIISYCLKILKAHLHMHQHNKHRLRISNSIASFVESASNRDQRDIILSKLIESVANFGNSGIIDNDVDGSSKIIIDNISRTLTNSIPKS